MREYWLKCDSIGIDQEINTSSIIGSENGCSIRLPQDESVARRHAMIVISDSGEWTIQAIHPHYPIYDANKHRVLKCEIQDNTAFKIGLHQFACHIIEKDIEQTPPLNADRGTRKPDKPIRPPEGVKSLQYFFQERIYRIGILGGKEFGKTCMLAALGMARIPRRDKASCTRIQHLRTPDPEPWEKTSEDQNAEAAFHAGKNLMDYGDTVDGNEIPGAIVSILQGNVPIPTPTSYGECRFVYKFAKPGYLPSTLESVDYSGEYVSPEMKTDRLAQHITDIMEASDGLILLAEVPAPGGDPEKEVEAIDKIAKAFAMLNIRDAIPVVLVVNKWDRCDLYDCTTAKGIDPRQPLREFVDSENGKHIKALEDAVRNTVGEDFFTMLPVSALGKCEVKNGIERPRNSLPLESFGLEDPFFWLIDRIDAKAAEDFRREIRGLSVMPWSALWSSKSRFLRQRHHELLAYEVRNKQMWPTIKKAGRLFAFKRFIAKCELGVLFAAALLTAEYAWSSRPYLNAYSELSKQSRPSTTNAYEESRRLVAVLTPYVKSLPIQHAIMNQFVNRQAASNVLAQAREKESGYLLSRIADKSIASEARIKVIIELKKHYPDVASETADTWRPLLQAHQTILADHVIRGEGSIQDRIIKGEQFLILYGEHASRDTVISTISLLRVATNLQSKLEAALRAKPEPDWKTFADLLTGAEYRQLIDESLCKKIVDDIKQVLSNKLLVYLNNSIGQLRDPTRIKDNDALKALLRTIEQLQRDNKLAEISKQFSRARDLLRKSILDRQLYAEASHTNRNAVNRYINDSTNMHIPGFMLDEIRKYAKKIFSGSIIIENIEWHRGKHERDISINVGYSGSVTKTNTRVDSKFVPGRKAAITNEQFAVNDLRHDANITISINATMTTRFKDEPVFIGNGTYYPEEMFKGISIKAVETENTGHGRYIIVYMRLLHNERVPSNWTAGRFMQLEGDSWGR